MFSINNQCLTAKTYQQCYLNNIFLWTITTVLFSKQNNQFALSLIVFITSLVKKVLRDILNFSSLLNLLKLLSKKILCTLLEFKTSKKFLPIYRVWIKNSLKIFLKNFSILLLKNFHNNKQSKIIQNSFISLLECMILMDSLWIDSFIKKEMLMRSLNLFNVFKNGIKINLKKIKMKSLKLLILLLWNHFVNKTIMENSLNFINFSKIKFLLRINSKF